MWSLLLVHDECCNRTITVIACAFTPAVCTHTAGVNPHATVIQMAVVQTSTIMRMKLERWSTKKFLAKEWRLTWLRLQYKLPERVSKCSYHGNPNGEYWIFRVVWRPQRRMWRETQQMGKKISKWQNWKQFWLYVFITIWSKLFLVLPLLTIRRR